MGRLGRWVFAMFLLGGGVARADPGPTSRYAALDPKAPGCRQDPGPAEGFACRGPDGWTVWVGFPAVGMTLVVNRPGAADLSPRDGRTLVLDGLVGLKPAVEWRGPTRAGRLAPTAAILRAAVLDPAQRDATVETGRTPERPRRAPVLLVFRLGPAGTCPIAYVDASTNPNANVLARAAADGPGTCPVDRVAVVGRSSPVLEAAIR